MVRVLKAASAAANQVVLVERIHRVDHRAHGLVVRIAILHPVGSVTVVAVTTAVPAVERPAVVAVVLAGTAVVVVALVQAVVVAVMPQPMQVR